MARNRAPPQSDDRMVRRPDDVASGGDGIIKTEAAAARPDGVPSSSAPGRDAAGDDDDDPVVRTIDVYLSPALSDTLRLVQFPVQPSARRQRESGRDPRRSSDATTPSAARFRPKHDMLELDYPIPSSARAAQRQLSDKVCLSERTFTSVAIAPATHMALARLNRSGERLNVIPLTKSVFQMRPSFRHLHDEEDDDLGPGNPPAADAGAAPGSGRQRPVLYQKRETERSVAARKNSYAYLRAAEEGEEWVELDVHGASGKWSDARRERMLRIKCPDRENVLRLARDPRRPGEGGDGGYVRSLNYLDSYALARGGEKPVEDLSEWAPSAVETIGGGDVADDDDDHISVHSVSSSASAAAPVGAMEKATAELASKLAVLLQAGNGAMVPYRVLRSRFHPGKVSDEVLTGALSSCAVLVWGNFSLKSELAKFLNLSGGGEERKKRMRELRDLILLLLNMHGAVQRGRLARTYASLAERSRGYEFVTPDIITFVLQTLARREKNCWVAKVEDDEVFASEFPECAACHGVYWMKKKELLMDMVDLYENVDIEGADGDDHMDMDDNSE